ncbi:MAG TPA: translation elongation factor Ts [Casimicrobiaceae bacterium]|nr:translation elongation factor Ts [Casimicrobiaceae bacterium]
MAEISASTVMELRQRTGLGMMECKKALTEAGGDIAKAEDILRIKSGAKASKASARVTAEGVIGLDVAADGKAAALVEVNCETDFVSRNDEFKAFANALAGIVVRADPADVAALAAAKLDSGETVEARRIALVQKIGENLSIRRFARRVATGRIASYVHGTKIGVLVDVSGGEPALGKDLAMHIAASKPESVDRTGLGADVIAKEREIATAQVAEEGKTGDMAAKIVEGKVAKLLAAKTLAGQPFVKGDGKETVEQLLKKSGAAVNGFTLYVVGEGIEKKKDDFAAEVAAMTRG